MGKGTIRIMERGRFRHFPTNSPDTDQIKGKGKRVGLKPPMPLWGSLPTNASKRKVAGPLVVSRIRVFLYCLEWICLWIWEGPLPNPFGLSVFDGLTLVLCFLILSPPPTLCSVFLSEWKPWFSLFTFACKRGLLRLSPGSLNLLNGCLWAQLFYKLGEIAKECISHPQVLGRGCERGLWGFY